MIELLINYFLSSQLLDYPYLPLNLLVRRIARQQPFLYFSFQIVLKSLFLILFMLFNAIAKVNNTFLYDVLSIFAGKIAWGLFNQDRQNKLRSMFVCLTGTGQITLKSMFVYFTVTGKIAYPLILIYMQAKCGNCLFEDLKRPSQKSQLNLQIRNSHNLDLIRETTDKV